MQNAQSNALVAALIIAAFLSLESRRAWRAAAGADSRPAQGGQCAHAERPARVFAARAGGSESARRTADAVAAHGGLDRWNQVKSITVGASITGAVWYAKSQGDALKDILSVSGDRPTVGGK